MLASLGSLSLSARVSGALAFGFASGIAVSFGCKHIRDLGAGLRKGISEEVDDPQSLLIGIDIGGTAVKVGLVTMSGIVVSQENKVLIDFTFDKVCDDVVDLVNKVLTDGKTLMKNVKGIGVCMPGIIDTQKSEVKFAANFSSWPRPAPLGELLRKKLNCGDIPIRLDNDGNAALLAEAWVGAVKGSTHAIMLTLGTGVGSAILYDGNLLRGFLGWGSEVGHTIVKPGGRYSSATGVHGILEEYVSARALGLIAQEAISDKRYSNIAKSSMLRTVSPKELITSKDVFEFAEQGDKLSLKLLDEFFELLGICCINLVRTLDIEHIVIGGGLAKAGKPLIEGIRNAYKKNHWNLSDPQCNIELAAYGNDAGFIGASYLAHPRQL